MLHSLDDAFVRTRLDAKYGVSQSVFPVTSQMGETMDEQPLRFTPTPSEPTRDITTVYAPRLHLVDERRARLLDLYRNTFELQDLRDIVSIPTSLTHITRCGLRHVRTSGQVRIDGQVVVIVPSREVGALLFQVARNTSGLQPSSCTRLVSHMCHNEVVASEWIACFGD